MRKKQDIMWEQSTLWESVEKWVTKYLKKSHSEYRELQVKAMRIVEENPALRILINSMEGIELTPEDHKALHKYIETKDEMTIFEYEYYYLAGQIMTFSYGRMLAQLKNEMLNEDSGASTHLIEFGIQVRREKNAQHGFAQERKQKSTDGVIPRIFQKQSSWKPVQRC